MFDKCFKLATITPGNVSDFQIYIDIKVNKPVRTSSNTEPHALHDSSRYIAKVISTLSEVTKTFLYTKINIGICKDVLFVNSVKKSELK